jgi:predicted nucleic acid-binding protein
MARYLLDTSVIIEFSRRREPSHALVHRLMQSNDDIGTCSIVVAEFFSGIGAGDHPAWRTFFSTLDFWLISQDVAEQAGHYRYTFSKRGIALALPDTLIAAVAVKEDATLVTVNDRHFPMTDIRLLIP